MIKTCAQCRNQFKARHSKTVYCPDCIYVRNKTASNKKTFYCAQCFCVLPAKGAYFCNDCYPLRRAERENWDENSGKNIAGRYVAKAKKSGLLPDLDKEFIACRDCGRRSQQYDHRDYQYPLLVDPVCRSCNVRRGKAKPRRAFAQIEAA